jgi:hypothetical protein
MMVRTPRQPVDLAAKTKFVHERVERALVELEHFALLKDPIFQSPQDVQFALWIAEREIANALAEMHQAWWSP